MIAQAIEALAAPLGWTEPRVGPPRPLRHDAESVRAAARCLGIDLMEWQDVAAQHIEALGADGLRASPEVGIVVARQNGKTELLLCLVHARLMAGRRIMHTAQNRALPRELFGRIAAHVSAEHRDLLPRRGTRVVGPRYGAGTEEIVLSNGGSYRIVAPNANGARGASCHDLLIDEARALVDWEFIAAAKPVLSLADAQAVYLSNAGTSRSVVLNALRDRAATDPALRWLEWSAEPGLEPDDPVAWAQANPMLGHEPPGLRPVAERLAQELRAARATGQLGDFETEHLCRYSPTRAAPIVDPGAWDALRADLRRPVRVVMGIAVDPSRRRAAAAVAGMQPDGSVGVRVVADVTGTPVDLDRMAAGRPGERGLVDIATRLRVAGPVACDPASDVALARHMRDSRPLRGAEFYAAAAEFTSRVELGRLRWSDAETVAEDIRWTVRRPNATGGFGAARADDEHTNTALLAVIRAVWLATQPDPPGGLTVR